MYLKVKQEELRLQRGCLEVLICISQGTNLWFSFGLLAVSDGNILKRSQLRCNNATFKKKHFYSNPCFWLVHLLCNQYIFDGGFDLRQAHAKACLHSYSVP